MSPCVWKTQTGQREEHRQCKHFQQGPEEGGMKLGMHLRPDALLQEETQLQYLRTGTKPGQTAGTLQFVRAADCRTLQLNHL